MFKLIIYGFLIYLLYKFIFELVIPVSKATSQVKDRMREMQRMQEEQLAQQQRYNSQATASEPVKASKRDDDYIEFEEVKK